MMKFLPWLLLTLALGACQRDIPLVSPNLTDSSQGPKIELALVGKAGIEDFVMRQWIPLPDGSKIRIDELKLYLSEIQFQNTQGNWINAKDYQFFDLSRSHSAAKTLHGKGERVSFSLPPGTYQSIRIGLGLAPWINKLDPTQFPASHDLSIYQGMYWDWNSGYRFFVIEGVQDTSGIGDPSDAIPFVYHLGTDSLYAQLDFEFTEITLSSNQGGVTPPALNLELDINKIFYNVQDTIIPVKDPVTHTSGNIPLAIRVKNNIENAWRVILE